METFRVISTERCLIRKLERKDIAVLFSYRSLPVVYKYQSWKPKTLADAEAFVEKHLLSLENTPDTWLQLAICLHDDCMIGDIGIHFLEDPDQVEIGYTLSPEYQGKGYAIESMRALIDHLFGDLHKHRIEASVDPQNERSIALLDRLGFRKEAHFIENFRMDGEWRDDCRYALLQSEWQKRRNEARMTYL
jgi:RimJ/RimL family protein N-acetyltransferase